MKRLAFLLGVLVALWCVPGQAADGDACDIADWQVYSGTVKTLWCVQICDEIVAADADSACDEVDIMDPRLGLPDVLVFEIDATTGCDNDPVITFTSSPETGGTEHDLGATSSVAVATNTKLTIDTTVLPIDRYILTALADIENCTDLDVLMIGYEKLVAR